MKKAPVAAHAPTNPPKKAGVNLPAVAPKSPEGKGPLSSAAAPPGSRGGPRKPAPGPVQPPPGRVATSGGKSSMPRASPSHPSSVPGSAKLAVRVLAIDAGSGVRAALPLLILAEIERRAGERAASLFDLVVGTSTGGVAALALTKRDPRTASDLAHEFFHKAVPFLSSLRGNKPLAEAAAGQDALVGALVGDGPLQSHTPRVAVLAYDEAKRAAAILRSWDAATASLDAKTAGRATSAAPVVLPAVDVHGVALRDGSMALGSAALQAWAEAKSTFPTDHPAIVVSLGCGQQRLEAVARASDPIRGFAAIVEGVTNGAASAIDQALRELLHGSYVRLDARPGQLPNTIEEVEAEAKAVIEANSAAIEELVRRLKR